jgi:hypothetical protein
MNGLDLFLLSAGLVDLYAGMKRRLMVKVAEQLASEYEINSSTEWQITKLAELGALSRETAEIITDSAGVVPEKLTDALRKASEITLEWLDSDEAGNMSADMLEIIENYVNQAKDRFNLVNTTMQFKADSAYVNAVNSVYEAWSPEERKEQAELINKQEYLDIINAETGLIVTGAKTRQKAIKDAILEMSDKGIPAFIDSAGREWSPEAYLSMVMRTTLANTSRETTFRYMREHGLDVMKISHHNNPRPLCAPFEKMLISISNKSGLIEDVNGDFHEYIPLDSTTYGEPAGLFGINCRHFGYPVREKAFYPDEKPPEKQSEEEKKAKERFEREWEVRESEIRAEMLERTGEHDMAEYYKNKAREDALKYRLNSF